MSALPWLILGLIIVASDELRYAIVNTLSSFDPWVLFLLMLVAVYYWGR